MTKNHSSLFAFEIGSGEIAEEGFKIVCAHSDSPTFKIKPNAAMPVAGKYLKLNACSVMIASTIKEANI